MILLALLACGADPDIVPWPDGMSLDAHGSWFAGTSSGDLWASRTGGDASLLFHWDGSTWTEVAHDLVDPLPYAVGVDEVVLAAPGSRRHLDTEGANVPDACPEDMSNVVAARDGVTWGMTDDGTGTDALVRCDAANSASLDSPPHPLSRDSTWDQSTHTSASGGDDLWARVAESDPSVVGAVMHWDGAEWTAIDVDDDVPVLVPDHPVFLKEDEFWSFDVAGLWHCAGAECAAVPVQPFPDGTEPLGVVPWRGGVAVITETPFDEDLEWTRRRFEAWPVGGDASLGTPTTLGSFKDECAASCDYTPSTYRAGAHLQDGTLVVPLRAGVVLVGPE